MPYTARLLLVLAAFGLTACGGTDRTEVRETTNVVHAEKTTGEQLIDLKAAYDQGIISEGEYYNRREAILARGY